MHGISASAREICEYTCKSGNSVIKKCLSRFDNWQSILYSWWGSQAVAVAGLFWIAVSPGSLVMVLPEV